ncbi:hypothetical protein Hypma_000809 [Hypsizygus marmoreus]|uniref:Uncharacterized protein n=1 Tax=Hypsizygus marmoreus TaxID=39966 RepID=A0A369J6X9_HYPMA|nr:hypothetical protein Hypma_000809 [Hypsizygus marmoreus]
MNSSYEQKRTFNSISIHPARRLLSRPLPHPAECVGFATSPAVNSTGIPAYHPICHACTAVPLPILTTFRPLSQRHAPKHPTLSFRLLLKTRRCIGSSSKRSKASNTSEVRRSTQKRKAAGAEEDQKTAPATKRWAQDRWECKKNACSSARSQQPGSI